MLTSLQATRVVAGRLQRDWIFSGALRVAAVLGWCLAMVAVTVLALMPIEHLQLPVLDWWDKAQHALAFAVLTGWALLLWPQWAGRVVLGMLAYGVGIELAQWAVGWRFAEWADLVSDAVGVSVAWMAVSGWSHFQSLKQERDV